MAEPRNVLVELAGDLTFLKLIVLDLLANRLLRQPDPLADLNRLRAGKMATMEKIEIPGSIESAAKFFDKLERTIRQQMAQAG